MAARVYVRLFDHEDAARRCADGESFSELAAEYGVTRNAVWRAVRAVNDPEWWAKEVLAHRLCHTTECELCGGPAMKLAGGKRIHNPDGRILCVACRGIVKRQRVRFDEDGVLVAVRCNMIDCANGERWQSPENFSRGVQLKDLREGGIHGICGACQTKNRLEYRRAGKVPCEAGCGRMVEGKGRANSRLKRGVRVRLDPDRPYLCHPCSVGKRGAVEAA